MARSALSPFHPLVAKWFKETLGKPSAPQSEGWPAIASRDDTLILAPTGTGKTLAAFLWELNQLIVDGLLWLGGRRPQGTRTPRTGLFPGRSTVPSAL